MRFRLFNTEIYISFLFMAIITAMIAVDRTGMVIPTLFAVIMHEIGHLFAMWVLESNPKQIRLIPASVQIVSKINSSFKNDIIISLAGPLINIVLFLTLFFNYLAFRNEITLYYAVLNLVIGVFNLLPVNGLDGGNILFSILAKHYSENKARLVLKIITISLAVIVLFFAVWLLFHKNFNISLFIIGIYLLISNLIKL